MTDRRFLGLGRFDRVPDLLCDRETVPAGSPPLGGRPQPGGERRRDPGRHRRADEAGRWRDRPRARPATGTSSATPGPPPPEMALLGSSTTRMARWPAPQTHTTDACVEPQLTGSVSSMQRRLSRSAATAPANSIVPTDRSLPPVPPLGCARCCHRPWSERRFGQLRTVHLRWVGLVAQFHSGAQRGSWDSRTSTR